MASQLAGPDTTAHAPERPGVIHAKPVRHPWRWVSIAVIVVLALMFLNMLFFNPAFNWPFVFEAMNQKPVIEGLIKGWSRCSR
jgi:polar amino acid transport system permease protein